MTNEFENWIPDWETCRGLAITSRRACNLRATPLSFSAFAGIVMDNSEVVMNISSVLLQFREPSRIAFAVVAVQALVGPNQACQRLSPPAGSFQPHRHEKSHHIAVHDKRSATDYLAVRLQ